MDIDENDLRKVLKFICCPHCGSTFDYYVDEDLNIEMRVKAL
jgi:hypothetical protein